MNDDAFADHDDELMDSEFFTNSNSMLVNGTLDNNNFASSRNTSTHQMDFMEDSHLIDGVTGDSESDIYIDININTEKDIETDKIDSDRLSDTETDADSDLSFELDASSVTDDGYFAGDEETGTIF